MKKSHIAIGIVAIMLIIFCFDGCSRYNKMVVVDENVKTAWAQVENQYQRRMDLIPNLVNTVKGYAEHEKSTFEAVVNGRNGLSDAYNNANENTPSKDALPTESEIQKFQQSQRQLQSALNLYVNAVHEAYPELKADETFKDLMAQLEGTENRIATERKRYNETAQNYNIMVRKFPGNIYAGIFGFNQASLFSAEEGAEKAPKVEF